MRSPETDHLHVEGRPSNGPWALPRHGRGPRSDRRVVRAFVALGVCVGLASGTAFGAGGAAPAGQADPVPAIVQIAKQQVGDGYRLGANGPDLWDCSGLTRFLWTHVGKVEGMPRVSRDQQRWVVPIPREQLLPGDLVFFGAPVSHVGLFVGGNRMVDASSSRKGVVERALWTSGVVRYGRVPREGMPAVRPWTPPPPPVDASTPSTAPAAAPAAPKPAAPKPTAPKPTQPLGAPRPVAVPVPASGAPSTGVLPLAGLPARQKAPSSAVMLRAATNARSVVGSGAWTDLSLVRTAWKHAGGGVLPDDRAALVAASRRVPLADVRVGDLVVYGAPAQHLGIYLGKGYMVDSSKVLGRVVVRRVFASETVRLVRPPVRR